METLVQVLFFGHGEPWIVSEQVTWLSELGLTGGSKSDPKQRPMGKLAQEPLGVSPDRQQGTKGKGETGVY